MLEHNYSTGYSTAPGFLGIKAQSQLDHRYLTEDVGYGLVFFTELAARLGVPTPAMDAVVTIASVVLARDFRAEGARTLTTLGLDGLSAEAAGRYLRPTFAAESSTRSIFASTASGAGRGDVEHAALDAGLRVALQPLRARRGGVDGDANRAMRRGFAAPRCARAARRRRRPRWASSGRRRPARGRARPCRCRRRGSAGRGAGPAWATTRCARSARGAPRSSPRRRARSPASPRRARASARSAARVDAVVAHLLHVPAGAHAEQQAPARQAVDARDRLGAGDRLALGDEADPECRPGSSRWPPRRGSRRRTGRAGGCTRAAARRRPGTASRGSRGCGCARGRTRTRTRAPRRGSPASRADRLVRGEDREPEVHRSRAGWRRSASRAARGRSAPRSRARRACAAWPRGRRAARRCSGLDS